ncbi:MAG: type I-C CRISPR-associated protein Cas5 [Chloroflexi bacterium]|nr:type I-C CRISPR-associated protein Cas5 [Chloroflexota bacterium]
MQTSQILSLRASGSLACFTRPELKVERVSYPVMTPSAARGLLEAILWKPAITWYVKRIAVLREIEFVSFRRNEVKDKMPVPSREIIQHGGPLRPFFIDEDKNHTQRNTVALRNVDYIVDAYFELTDKAGSEDNLNKFEEMFQRRVEKGQHFHQPYFGCREFVADIMSATGAPAPINDSRDLGLMLWDIEYGDRNRPIFFSARLSNGVLEVTEKPDAQEGGA